MLGDQGRRRALVESVYGDHCHGPSHNKIWYNATVCHRSSRIKIQYDATALEQPVTASANTRATKANGNLKGCRQPVKAAAYNNTRVCLRCMGPVPLSPHSGTRKCTAGECGI
jgi:hypothetical protein